MYGQTQHHGVTLDKGQGVTLNKLVDDLHQVAIALGWDVRATAGADFDLDASALLLNDVGRVLGDSFFVFYNNLQSPDGSVRHTGDNLTGDGEGDDETLYVDLDMVPPACQRIIFPVSIHQAAARGQSFGQVSNAYIRVYNRADGVELTRYNLTEDAANETAMIFGELFREGREWRFRAVGQGYLNGLYGIIVDHGVNVR
jgi:tellurium resistance protein TerD